MRPPDSISVQRALTRVHDTVADHQFGVVSCRAGAGDLARTGDQVMASIIASDSG